MQRDIEFKSFNPDQRIQRLIGQMTAKLEKQINVFAPELAHFRLFIDFVRPRTLYEISLTLDLHGKGLVAREQVHDLKAGIRAAFEEIERQLKKYKDGLHGEHWKRPSRRAEVRWMRAHPAGNEETRHDAFFVLVTPHLKRLNRFVHHVIAYAEAEGDLMPGDLTSKDIVDGTLVRGFRDFASGRTIREVQGWLIRRALDQLESEVRRLKRERAGTVTMEPDSPEAPVVEDQRERAA